MIHLASPIIGNEEIAAVTRVMRTGMIAQGSEVAAFEQEFAAALDAGASSKECSSSAISCRTHCTGR